MATFRTWVLPRQFIRPEACLAKIEQLLPTEKDARGMTIADITLTAFTLCNSLRVVAYFPQIARAVRDTSGAEAISFGTWGLFLVSHTSATAYAVVNQADWTMASVFIGNAIGCSAILLIAAWKRTQHRRGRIAGAVVK
jgi:hypothetical protein